MGGGEGTAWPVFHLYHHHHNSGHAGRDVGDYFEGTVSVQGDIILEYALLPAHHKNLEHSSSIGGGGCDDVGGQWRWSRRRRLIRGPMKRLRWTRMKTKR